MTYRPDGWNARKIAEDEGEAAANDEMIGLIEAGASAMLEALRNIPYLYSMQKGDYVEYIRFPFTFVAPYNGHFAFIPDDVPVDNKKALP